MKINVIPTLIAAAISALLAYALFAFGVSHRLIMAIGGFLCFFVTLTGAVAVRFEQGRTSTNTAVLGWVFFLILVVSHIIFSRLVFAAPLYIIVNGILALAFLGVTYAVAKTKQ